MQVSSVFFFFFLVFFLLFGFLQLITLCEQEDAVLSKLPCYKGIQSLTSLKASGLGKECCSSVQNLSLSFSCLSYKLFYSPFSFPPIPSAALAASAYLNEMRERIFSVLYRAINSTSSELQKAGKEGMRKVC